MIPTLRKKWHRAAPLRARRRARVRVVHSEMAAASNKWMSKSHRLPLLLLRVVFQCMLQQLVFGVYSYSLTSREIGVKIDESLSISGHNVIRGQSGIFVFF